MPSAVTSQFVSQFISPASVRKTASYPRAPQSDITTAEANTTSDSGVRWLLCVSQAGVVRTIGKGDKDGYAPFGELSEGWLNEYQPKRDVTIWDIGFWGIKNMLDDLSKETGPPANPHTFRRTFARLLRKVEVNTMTIKDLGRWESHWRWFRGRQGRSRLKTQ